jgi:hypothetical protein
MQKEPVSANATSVLDSDLQNSRPCSDSDPGFVKSGFNLDLGILVTILA